MEAFYNVWNTHLIPHPRTSTFMRQIIKEDNRWRTAVEDYMVNPGDRYKGRNGPKKHLDSPG